MNTISTLQPDYARSGRLFIRRKLHAVKVLLAKVYRLLRGFVIVPRHTTMRIEHLHKGCRRIGNPSRQIFILYVKGYSINEISELSGTTHDDITSIVRHTVNSIHKLYN